MRRTPNGAPCKSFGLEEKPLLTYINDTLWDAMAQYGTTWESGAKGNAMNSKITLQSTNLCSWCQFFPHSFPHTRMVSG